MAWTKEEKEEVYREEEERKEIHKKEARQITEQDLYDMEVADEMD